MMPSKGPVQRHLERHQNDPKVAADIQESYRAIADGRVVPLRSSSGGAIGCHPGHCIAIDIAEEKLALLDGE